MKRARYSARALLFVIALLVSLAVSSGAASATGMYDDSYQSTSTLKTSSSVSGYSCDPIDLTYDWASYLTNESKWYGSFDYSAARTSFLSAITNQANGAWGVHQYHDNNQDAVQFWWTEDPSAHLIWDVNGVNIDADTNIHIGAISCSKYMYGNGGSTPVVTAAGLVDAFRITTSPSFSVSNGYSLKALFVHGFTLNEGEGYEGEPILTRAPTARYVAMGDSFSSGEGNSPFEAGTDEDDVNECHRSTSAYPRWLSQTPSLNLERINLVACSGASTANVLHGGISDGAWNESPQVDALSDDTGVVTITIGGNDIGFGTFATACAAPDSRCDSSTTIYSTTMYNIHNVLPGSLEDVLTEIAGRTAHAKVYVIGYPYITPASGLSSLPIQCSYLSSSAGDGADSLAARDVVTELNGEISNAVTGFTNTFSGTTFEYIDPNASIDGSFDGRDLCQGLDSYFHNVAPNDVFGNGYRQKIFHPNVNGQYEYYQIVSELMALG